jgi:hypothetical protein
MCRIKANASKPESMLESGDMLLALIVYMSNYISVFGRIQDHNMANGTASSNDAIEVRTMLNDKFKYRARQILCPFKPVGGLSRRPSATNGESTLRGDEESACAHKLESKRAD